MGTILILYSIFSITTLIVILRYTILPIVTELYNTKPTPRIVEEGNKFLIVTALSVLTLIVAPIMFLVWIIPNLNEQFTAKLLEELKKS